MASEMSDKMSGVMLLCMQCMLIFFSSVNFTLQLYVFLIAYTIIDKRKVKMKFLHIGNAPQKERKSEKKRKIEMSYGCCLVHIIIFFTLILFM